MKKLLTGFALCLWGMGLSAPLVLAEEGCPKDGNGYCIELRESINGTKVIKGKNGIDLIGNYIQTVYMWGASIIGIVCVGVIVISGIQISMGGANSEFVNQGKERIMQALLSLLLLFGSAMILKTVNPGFFGNDPAEGASGSTTASTEAAAGAEGATGAAGPAGPTPAPKDEQILLDGFLGPETADAIAKCPDIAARHGLKGATEREASSFVKDTEYSETNPVGRDTKVSDFQRDFNAEGGNCSSGPKIN